MGGDLPNPTRVNRVKAWGPRLFANGNPHEDLRFVPGYREMHINALFYHETVQS